MGKIEVLAPAGGHEQLIAAVRSGANAVYLGLNNFNARANAHNFSEPKEVVSFCHARGVKVHFTVNTLVNDNELPSLYDTLKSIAQAGADAVIVQDFATAEIVKNCFPQLPMHASTQMTVHNIPGVKLLEESGFSRVVLSRELSHKEIEKICKNTSLEVEVFVHGALCMCMSGSCYLSSVLGARSGNRGYCAQPCRLNFNCNGRNYALSLKDMCSIPYIKDLENAGVCSLKIEGRMKRPEYVASAVDCCLKEINGQSPDLDTLKSVFSRSGFTDGYLKNKINVDMFGYRTKEDVTASEKVIKSIHELYKNERNSVKVDFEFSAYKDKPIELTAKHKNCSVKVFGEPPVVAQNRPANADVVIKQLSKTGGTQFFADSVTAKIDEDIFIPIPQLNSIRKNALSQLNERLEKIIPLPVKPLPDFDYRNIKRNTKPKIYIRCEKIQQIRSVADADRYFIPLDEIEKHPEIINIYGEKIVGEMPQICWDEQSETQKLEKLIKLGLKNVSAHNLWAIKVAKELKLNIFGGYGLNIFNSLSVLKYADFGLKELTLSFELSGEKINNVKSPVPVGILAYGYLPLMQVRCCPAKNNNGCGNCNGQPVLTDRMGNVFPLICRNRQYSTVLNLVPLDIRGKPVGNVDFYTLWFTKETEDECADIYNSFKSTDEINKNPKGKYTRGLYYKEVF